MQIPRRLYVVAIRHCAAAEPARACIARCLQVNDHLAVRRQIVRPALALKASGLVNPHVGGLSLAIKLQQHGRGRVSKDGLTDLLNGLVLLASDDRAAFAKR